MAQILLILSGIFFVSGCIAMIMIVWIMFTNNLESKAPLIPYFICMISLFCIVTLIFYVLIVGAPLSIL